MKIPILGLLGHPLGHSFSRDFFIEKFAKEGITCQYENFDFETIEAGVAVLEAEPNLCGFNVTIPYKEAIISKLKTLSVAAKVIGAVNTVVIAENGDWHGENTDHLGFAKAIRSLVSSRYIKKALILGTGGSSKAVAYALKELDISFRKVSRLPKGEDFFYEHLSIKSMADFQLIINCTPFGMKGIYETKSPLKTELVLPQHTVFDLVYNPFPTPLLSMTQNPENLGLVMLEAQALAAWQLWQASPKYLSFQK